MDSKAKVINGLVHTILPTTSWKKKKHPLISSFLSIPTNPIEFSVIRDSIPQEFTCWFVAIRMYGSVCTSASSFISGHGVTDLGFCQSPWKGDHYLLDLMIHFIDIPWHFAVSMLYLKTVYWIAPTVRSSMKSLLYQTNPLSMAKAVKSPRSITGSSWRKTPRHNKATS